MTKLEEGLLLRGFQAGDAVPCRDFENLSEVEIRAHQPALVGFEERT